MEHHICFFVENHKKIKLFFARKRTQIFSQKLLNPQFESSDFYHNSNSLFHFTKIIIFELYNILLIKYIYLKPANRFGNT
tara:strand:- start:3749 stop:3988 length:240 start_codon:yes stop_codon:yes gene_type:complete